MSNAYAAGAADAYPDVPDPGETETESPEVAAEREVAAEQQVVDGIYRRLAAATESAQALKDDGYARARLGNEGGLVERDAMVYQASRRLATLESAHEGLVFGRLDMTSGDVHYIGRLGLRDENHEVVLVDWRAPAASTFYQATPHKPRGVIRRRVLRSRGATVVGVEDDLLDATAAPDDMAVVGEGALFASLSRSRDATMHSIVATIQAEQDRAIRAPHKGVTTITGGPGTGKTVVALHRAAYLLYTDRSRYEGGGVVVIGPNAVFMAYIERVLPSLGETSVTLRSVGEVVEGIRATRHDGPDVALVKGSARMVKVLRRTARGPAPGAPDSLRLFYRDDVLRLDAKRLGALRRRLLGDHRRRNQAYPHVAEAVADALWEQVSGDRAASRGRVQFGEDMWGEREFRHFVRDWWPAVDAVDVYGWLADRDRFARDAKGILTPEEIDETVETLAADDYSIEDVPLLDELRYLLGELPEPDEEYDPSDDLVDSTLPEVTTTMQRWEAEVQRSREDDDRARPTSSIEDDTYAHVLVDEAQDLTPMQWRMVGRRGRRASWTIVGDAAQSSWPYDGEAAAARDEALKGKDQSAFRMSTNYRNSAEIAELAAEVARAHIPGADCPDAVRRTGVEPDVREVEPPYLAAEVRDVVREVADEVDGTVGVVAPLALLDDVRAWVGGLGLGGRVSVLAALDTKGLEFDVCVVVEPDLVAGESEAGIRVLYVVLTRATQRLATVGTTSTWRP